VAYNAAGDSPSAPTVVAVTGSPAAPTSLSAALQTGPQALLTWTDNAIDETGFVVERAVNGGGFVQLATPAAGFGTGSVTYTDTTVTPGNTYDYRVMAVNGIGPSSYSNTANLVVPDLPTAPASLTAALQVGPQAFLTWTDNATNETGFVVERAVNGGAFTQLAAPAALAGTGSVTYTDATIIPGNTYDYRVAAVNGFGPSAYSNTAGVVVPSTPAAPTVLTAALQVGPQTLLTWTDNATDETGFVVERAVNGGAFAQLTAPAAQAGTGSVTYTDTTITPGNTYDYRVMAVNGVVTSVYSNTAGVIVPSIPAAPTQLNAQAQLGPRIVLAWEDNATDETGFVLERAVNGGGFTQLTVLGPRVATGGVTYTDNAVIVGNTYSYRVKTVNGVISSAFSNTATATAIGPPAAPSSLTVSLVVRTATLQWIDNANNETGFTIQRATNSAFNRGLTTINVGANVVTRQVTGLSRRQTYYFRVRASNSYGTSAWSNVVSVTTP
jgi:hypothetical protein